MPAGRPHRRRWIEVPCSQACGRRAWPPAVVAAVADAPVIGRDPGDAAIEQTRDPAPGECLAATDRLARRVSRHAAAASPASRTRSRAGDPAVVLAIEGCDFLEGELDRLDAMAARGVRSMQLDAYRGERTGDIQTDAAACTAG